MNSPEEDEEVTIEDVVECRIILVRQVGEAQTRRANTNANMEPSFVDLTWEDSDDETNLSLQGENDDSGNKQECQTPGANEASSINTSSRSIGDNDHGGSIESDEAESQKPLEEDDDSDASGAVEDECTSNERACLIRNDSRESIKAGDSAPCKLHKVTGQTEKIGEHSLTDRETVGSIGRPIHLDSVVDGDNRYSEASCNQKTSVVSPQDNSNATEEREEICNKPKNSSLERTPHEQSATSDSCATESTTCTSLMDNSSADIMTANSFENVRDNILGQNTGLNGHTCRREIPSPGVDDPDTTDDRKPSASHKKSVKCEMDQAIASSDDIIEIIDDSSESEPESGSGHGNEVQLNSTYDNDGGDQTMQRNDQHNLIGEPMRDDSNSEDFKKAASVRETVASVNVDGFVEEDANPSGSPSKMNIPCETDQTKSSSLNDVIEIIDDPLESESEQDGVEAQFSSAINGEKNADNAYFGSSMNGGTEENVILSKVKHNGQRLRDTSFTEGARKAADTVGSRQAEPCIDILDDSDDDDIRVVEVSVPEAAKLERKRRFEETQKTEAVNYILERSIMEAKKRQQTKVSKYSALRTRQEFDPQSSFTAVRGRQQIHSHPNFTFYEPKKASYKKNRNTRRIPYNYTEQSALEEQERLFKQSAARVKAQGGVEKLLYNSHDFSDDGQIYTHAVNDLSSLPKNHFKWKNPYSRLGVPRRSKLEIVKKNYRKLCLLYHPDKVRNNSKESQHRFQAIKEAYEEIKETQGL